MIFNKTFYPLSSIFPEFHYYGVNRLPTAPYPRDCHNRLPAAPYPRYLPQSITHHPKPQRLPHPFAQPPRTPGNCHIPSEGGFSNTSMIISTPKLCFVIRIWIKGESCRIKRCWANTRSYPFYHKRHVDFENNPLKDAKFEIKSFFSMCYLWKEVKEV